MKSLDINDVWNLRFGALWDPSKIKDPWSNRINETPSDYGQIVLSKYNDSLLMPQEYIEDFKDHFSEERPPNSFWKNFDVDGMFSPVTEQDNEKHEHIKDWMKERNIPWIALDGQAGGSGKWLLEADKNKQMPDDAFGHLLDTLIPDDFMGSISLSSRPFYDDQNDKNWEHLSFTYNRPPDFLEHGHDDDKRALQKSCPRCVDHLYKTLYPSEKTAALWDPSKVKQVNVAAYDDYVETHPRQHQHLNFVHPVSMTEEDLAHFMDKRNWNNRSIDEGVANVFEKHPDVRWFGWNNVKNSMQVYPRFQTMMTERDFQTMFNHSKDREGKLRNVHLNMSREEQYSFGHLNPYQCACLDGDSGPCAADAYKEYKEWTKDSSED